MKFECGAELTHLLPASIESSKGTGCFTDAACTKPGTLPGGVEITTEEKKKKVYTVRMTKLPTADAVAYFLCTDTDQLPSSRQVAKKCTVELKIKGSPPVSKLQSFGPRVSP